jgi:hypothetical protein
MLILEAGLSIIALIILLVIGLVILVVVVGSILLFLPAAIIAFVVWFLTGDLFLAGVAFLIIAVLMIIFRH